MEPKEIRLEFYEECASQWYDRLPDADKKMLNSLNKDLIGQKQKFTTVNVTKFTKNEYELRAKALAKISNAQVPAESLFTLDNHIAVTTYAATPILDFLSPVTKILPAVRQTSKTYAGTDLGDAKLVGAGNKFNHPPLVSVDISPTYVNALGVHIGYELDFSEIDENKGGLYDIEWYFALKAGEKEGTLIDQKLCLGELCELAEIDAGNVKGIHNYGSLQEGKMGNLDNVLTSAGDLRNGMFTGLAAINSGANQVHEAGDVWLICTSGVVSELLLKQDSYGVTDWAIFKRDFIDTGLIKGIIVDNNIEKDANAVATARAMLLKVGPTTMSHEVVYPLQSRLMATTFKDDVKVMLMHMSIYKMYNANAGFICDGDCTTTTTGIFKNGVVAI